MSPIDDLSLSLKNIEELYNTTRVSQERRLGKISKQLEGLEVTLRKIHLSKKKAPIRSGIDKGLECT